MQLAVYANNLPPDQFNICGNFDTVVNILN